MELIPEEPSKHRFGKSLFLFYFPLPFFLDAGGMSRWGRTKPTEGSQLSEKENGRQREREYYTK